jgi:Flp pilus assembly pilin Flp
MLVLVRMRRAARRDNGAAAVEFALLITPLVLILFGILSFGLYFAGSLGLSNASREAARYGVVQNRTCEQIASTLRDSVDGTIGIVYPIDFTVARPGAAGCAGSIARQSDGSLSISYSAGQSLVVCKGSKSGQDELTVSTSATANVLIPLWLIDDNFPLDSKGTYRCEFS